MLNQFRTYQLATQFYKDIKRLGLKGEIRDQLERASLSVVCNLAEGSGKSHNRDRKRYFEIALGSVRESQALIGLLDHPHLADQADKLGAYLWKLGDQPSGPPPASPPANRPAGSPETGARELRRS